MSATQRPLDEIARFLVGQTDAGGRPVTIVDAGSQKELDIEVIVPVETGYFSLHGLSKQLELLEQLRKQCRQEIRIRILATLYDIRTKLAREVLAELRDQFGGFRADDVRA